MLLRLIDGLLAPNVSSYFSSKDAYMAVYARREVIGNASRLPPEPFTVVKPPKEVIAAIESMNARHREKCEEWIAECAHQQLRF